MPSRISTEKRTRSVPEGVWIKCPKCDAQLYRNELERNLQVLSQVRSSHACRRAATADTSDELVLIDEVSRMLYAYNKKIRSKT